MGDLSKEREIAPAYQSPESRAIEALAACVVGLEARIDHMENVAKWRNVAREPGRGLPFWAALDSITATGAAADLWRRTTVAAWKIVRLLAAGGRGKGRS